MKPFPWEQAIGFGLGVLRLPPEQFWRMTPRELACAVAAVRGPVSAPPGPGAAGSYCSARMFSMLTTRGWSSLTAMFSANTKATPNTSKRLEYQTVSRKRMLRVNAGMCTLEDVPLSADGLDELILEAFV